MLESGFRNVMERAGKLLAKFVRSALSGEELVSAAWPAAAGSKVAARTRVVGMVRSCLVIEVDDALWQRNLHGLRFQILRNFKELLSDAAPADLEFRIGARRRPPAIEQPALIGADEANAIDDPVWRHLYKVSRRKALA